MKPVSCKNHGIKRKEKPEEEEGETAWSKIGVNLFEIKGRSYLQSWTKVLGR